MTAYEVYLTLEDCQAVGLGGYCTGSLRVKHYEGFKFSVAKTYLTISYDSCEDGSLTLFQGTKYLHPEAAPAVEAAFDTLKTLVLEKRLEIENIRLLAGEKEVSRVQRILEELRGADKETD